MSDFEKDINKRLKELLDMEDLDEANVTANLDGGEGPVKTPGAFGDVEDDTIEQAGYKKVKENKSTYAQMMSQLHLQEASYNSYKRDDTMSNKKKVNQAISEINRKLFEVEKIMRQNVRLKTEVGVDNSQYWKGTKQKLGKISERILKIAHQFRNLSA
jgi:hypothetical protein